MFPDSIEKSRPEGDERAKCDAPHSLSGFLTPLEEALGSVRSAQVAPGTACQPEGLPGKIRRQHKEPCNAVT